MITTYLTLYTSCVIAIIIYAGFISKRYAELTFPFLLGKKIDFDVSIDRMKLFFTFIFFSFSIFLFKSFTKLKFDNILTYNIGISLILILIIFFIWLDVKKIASLKNNETEKTTSLKKENLINLKLNSVTTKESSTNDSINYEEFLSKIKSFKFFDKKSNSLELTSFKVSGEKSLKLKQAYFILMIFWFEEIAKDKTYLDSLDSSFYLKINNSFLEKNPISKQNWNYFKKHYILDLKIEDLKKSDFYKELLNFYKKKDSK